MSLDLCFKQLHVVHIKGFQRIQYMCLLLFQSVIFYPSFSSPANSTPATSSVIFQSCKFHPLFLDGPSFSTPANSSHPSFSRYCVYVSFGPNPFSGELKCGHSQAYYIINKETDNKFLQDAQLSQRDRAAGCVTVFAKIEDSNWETIFYGHYRSIFNHCDIIGLKICRIP